MRENPLGSEKISSLLKTFAIPSITATLVGSLYNIVDQVFIGQGVGYLGNAATNVSYPLSTICLAISLLIGIGSASRFSIYLGQNEPKHAATLVGNGIVLMVIAGILYLLLGEGFLSQLLWVFGATDEVMPFARQYAGITLLGMPFLILTNGISNLIRADGSPKYSMVCMVAGAIANTILDPIFIFAFQWGVFGAALATILGQILSFLLALRYLWHFRTVTLTKDCFKIQVRDTFRTLYMGTSSCLNQIAITIVQIVLNHSLTYYGALSVYGQEIPLAACGIVMKTNAILLSIIVGISQGVQPIIGYNFGANHYARVQKTFHIASLIAVGISVVWFLIFMVFPRQIASCFVSDNALYLDCAQHCFRLYMLAFFLYGLHMTSASFFQGIGRPGKSLLIPLARQGCFLIPLALLLSRSFGLDGALLAAPIADALAFLLCLLLARWEFRSWRRKGWLCKGERKYRAS